MRASSFRTLLIASTFLALVIFRLWNGKESDDLRRTRLLMGTVVEINVRGGDHKKLDDALNEAFDEMIRMEQLFSPDIPSSDVARVNRLPEGDDVASEVLDVITAGLDVATKSGGAFDMTLGALIELWGIGGETPQVPSNDALERAMADTGPGALSVTGSRLTRNHLNLKIDLGGIAKGYAVDRAIAVLKRHGVVSASVNAGGDIGLLGERDGRPWRIGIQDPRDPEKVIATVDVMGKSVVTSGDYERYFEVDGVRYHHLFDPRTGYPATRCRSVTIIAPTSLVADALATAVFVLGPSDGLHLLEAFPATEALIIAADGSVTTTPGLQGAVRWH